MGKLPQTPRAKKVIEYAIEEARNLNHNYVGTEHLLLGLLREEENVGAQILMNLGLELKDVRWGIMCLLGQAVPDGETMQAVFQRLARRTGRCLRQHLHFTIFGSGVAATLAAGWIVASYVENDTVSVGAFLGGVVYVSAVALATYLARQQSENKA